MFAETELEQLEETKQLLVAQADLHRNLLCMEAARWGEKLDHLQAVQQSFTSYRGIILAVTAGAGLLAAKRGRSLFRWVPVALGLWRSVRKFMP